MRDARHILLDDGTGIQFCCYIMACCTNNLHTAFPCLMIRFGTDESRKEGVVDVDDVVRIGIYHLIANDLHIASENDESHILFLQQFHLSLFHFSLIAMVFLYAPYIIRKTELFSHISQIFVIAHDKWYIYIIFSCLPSCEQVVEAVAHFADEDSHTRFAIGEIEIANHLITLCIERIDIFKNLVARNEKLFQIPFNAHEEHAILSVNILIEIENVAMVVCDKLCYLRNDARLVGTVQQENCC